MILLKEPDPRFITIRRVGTLTDLNHQFSPCGRLPVQPSDPRPRQAIDLIPPWVRGEIRISQSRAAAASNGEEESVGRLECQWQREQLHDRI
jgi:hypothetical protein